MAKNDALEKSKSSFLIDDNPPTNSTHASSDFLFAGNEASNTGNNSKNEGIKNWFRSVFGRKAVVSEDIPLRKRQRSATGKSDADDPVNETPEPRAFFASRWTYAWLDPLLRVGFKRPLENKDLYLLDGRFLTGHLANQFEKEWEQEVAAQLNDDKRKASTVRVLARIFGPKFYFAGFYKLLSDCCQIGSPIVAMYLIKFIESFQDGDNAWPLWIGWFLLFLLLLLQLLGSLFLNYYFLICMWTGLRVRGTLVSVVYRKTLRLDDKARQDFTNGKIINMVSTDVSRLDSLMSYLHVIWSSPFQLIVIVALLIWQLGVAALVGLGVLAICVPVQAKIMKSLVAIRKENAKLTDQRIRQIGEMLSGIRVIKFFAWEPFFQSAITDTRERESNRIRALNVLRNLTSAIALGIPAMAMALSFVVYSLLNKGLMSPSAVFGSLAYFNLLRFPMMMLPMVISQIADCTVALKRITSLLKASELSPVIELMDSEEFGVEIDDASFQWEVTMDEKLALPDVKQKSTDVLLDNAKPHPLSPLMESDEELPTGGISSLSNITLKVPKGKLTAVVGAVGSGKSSLLNAIIGEMKCTSGRVRVSGSVGYTAQQAWIMNATLKDNIIFGRELEQKDYKRVIKACALESDLAMLPNGDQTEIGERGINLSGGQKQRVNLARCVYLDHDIVLMDDPLSAVDAHVGKYLFEQCICGALANKTRVLVTHQLHFLSRADFIVVLANGHITEQGTFKELIGKKGEFQRLMASYGGQEEESLVTDEGNAASVPASLIVAGSKEPSAADLDADASQIPDKKKDKLMMSEERAKGSVDWEVYKVYFKAAGGYSFAVGMVIFLIISQAVRLLTDMWLVWWVTPIYENGQQVSSGIFPLSQGGYIGVYISFSLAQVISVFVFGVLFCFGGFWASVLLHRLALARIFHAPISFFDRTPLGRIINRFSKDTDAMDNTLPGSFRMFTSTLGSAIATLVLILIATPFFGLPLIPLMIIYGFVQLLYRRSSREVKRLESLGRSPLYAHFSETMSGLPTIRAYGEQPRFMQWNEELMDAANRPYYVQIVLQRWLGLRLETIGGFLVFFAGLFGVTARNSINPSLIGLSLSYVLQITSTLNWCVRQFTETEIQMNSVERIDYYASNLESEAPPVIPDKRPSKNWPSEGNIVFRNVSMKYQPHLPLTLHDISFSITGGEKIGIVGRTGAGKSSILNALFRIVELSEGQIYVDDINAADIGLSDLRSVLGIIPQDPVLFQGTVRSNLDPTLTRYSDTELWEALEKANLKEAVSRAPGKLDSSVAEGGENWSVGQRQLFCLARAMLKKPRICILDEATANVDFESDAVIQKALRVAFKQSTIITIAHRVNTIIDYDRVLVLGKGRILEFDQPSELLKNEKGFFYSMVRETGEKNAELMIKAASNKNKVQLEQLLTLDPN